MMSSRLKVFVLVLTAAVCGCGRREVVLLAPLPTVRPPEAVSSSGAVQVYFTRPDAPESKAYRGGPAQALITALDAALFEIDLAVYDLNLWGVRDALLRAHRRGVRVRVVVDQGHAAGDEIQALRDAGIAVVSDTGEGLMHHKFLVIDGAEVWTGSMNLTVNGAYRNDNHLVRIKSRRLAENFRTEFEEMHQRQFFGPDVLENTPYPRLEIAGGRVDTYFSPDDHPRRAILEKCSAAKESIDFLAFSYTSDEIARVMRERASRGVNVRGVFDSSQLGSGRGSEFAGLVEAGVPVCRDGGAEKMHHKVIIVDRRIVITGSYNFSRSAEEVNDENLLVIDHPGLAEEFLQEFERVYGACR